MLLQLLLLLILLGSGRSLRLWETWEDGAKEASGRLLARNRRQATTDEDFDTYEGPYDTDPPEMLENSTGTVTLNPKLQAFLGTLGQRDSAGPGIPEAATLETATGNSAGLDIGGTAIGNFNTELATQGILLTEGFLTKEPVTSIPPIMEISSTQGPPSTELATMKSLSTGPAATEALFIKSTVTEALPTGPAATEALTTQLTAMEELTTGPTFMEPTTTETPPKEPATVTALSTQPATTRGPTTALLVPSDLHRGTTVAVGNSSDGFIKQRENSQRPSPGSSVSPSRTGGLDYIPVKHCLLAILILALVATTFLVCTVVLAVRLSRKNHMYPVRSYSPTEMVCISSLLPEGDEGPTVTANGNLPTTKSSGLKEVSGEDHEGDDLTLHSFLP